MDSKSPEDSSGFVAGDPRRNAVTRLLLDLRLPPETQRAEMQPVTDRRPNVLDFVLAPVSRWIEKLVMRDDYVPDERGRPSGTRLPPGPKLIGEKRRQAMARAAKLIRGGALGDDPGAFRVDSTPVLPYACAHGLLPVVEALLAVGVDPHGPPGQKEGGPLAEARRRGDAELERLLLAAGADSLGQRPGAGVEFQSWGDRGRAEGIGDFWNDLEQVDFQVIFARAPIDAVGEAYARLAGAVAVERDVRHRNLPASGDGRFLVQMRGCPWTAVLEDLGRLDRDFSVPRTAKKLSKKLATETVCWTAYDGDARYELYDRGTRLEVLDEEAALAAVDVDDDEAFQARGEEVVDRILAFFDGRGVWLPPATEEDDGLRTWLRLDGVEAADVQRVDYVVLRPS